MIDSREHWDRVYRTKGDRDVSWFEPHPSVSLEMIEAAGLDTETCVVDIGGGNSRLVDALIARGVRCVAVLDVSGVALANARARLGADSSRVTWIEADVTGEWSVAPVDIWHDRAVFHFLTEVQQRDAYRVHLRQTLRAGGTAIIATFALDGPERCSGLPVVRYSPETLAAEFGPEFELAYSRSYRHVTPSGSAQSFQYARLGWAGRAG